MKVARFEEDWGEELLARVDDYMEQLYVSVEDGGDPPTLTGYPYCGCEVCHERERTFAIVTFALEGAEAGRVRLEEAS